MLKQIAVACQQNGHRAAQHLPQREIPRHHRQNRAKRSIRDNRFLIFDKRRFSLQHRRTVLGIPVAKRGGFGHFGPRLHNRLAHFAGHHLRHLFGASPYRHAQVAQLLRAVRDAFMAPLTKACVSERDSIINVVLRRPRVRRERFAIRRVNRQCVSGRGMSHEDLHGIKVDSLWPTLLFLKTE
ncbi:hypothetical protein D3C80_1015810 [compost metagenome]